MASKKAIIGIAVAIVVIAVIAIAASGGSDDEPDVRYDYEAYLTDTLGTALTAPEGQQFLVIDYALANDGDEEISTNYMYADWTATIDGITYTASAVYSVSADGYQMISIQPGAVGTSAAVILVPEDCELSDLDIGYDLNDFSRHVIAYDDSLL